MTLSISEVLALQDLKRRVKALELALAKLAESRTAAAVGGRRPGALLRDRIERLVSADPAACAKLVLHELARSGFEPLPALRTVQYHLRALRQMDTTSQGRSEYHLAVEQLRGLE